MPKVTNRWTKQQIDYLSENYGKVSLERMAAHLGKTEMATIWNF